MIWRIIPSSVIGQNQKCLAYSIKEESDGRYAYLYRVDPLEKWVNPDGSFRDAIDEPEAPVEEVTSEENSLIVKREERNETGKEGKKASEDLEGDRKGSGEDEGSFSSFATLGEA